MCLFRLMGRFTHGPIAEPPVPNGVSRLMTLLMEVGILLLS
jgi:hypothetical protein